MIINTTHCVQSCETVRIIKRVVRQSSDNVLYNTEKWSISWIESFNNHFDQRKYLDYTLPSKYFFIVFNNTNYSKYLNFMTSIRNISAERAALYATRYRVWMRSTLRNNIRLHLISLSLTFIFGWTVLLINVMGIRASSHLACIPMALIVSGLNQNTVVDIEKSKHIKFQIDFLKSRLEA